MRNNNPVAMVEVDQVAVADQKEDIPATVVVEMMEMEVVMVVVLERLVVVQVVLVVEVDHRVTVEVNQDKLVVKTVGAVEILVKVD